MILGLGALAWFQLGFNAVHGSFSEACTVFPVFQRP